MSNIHVVGLMRRSRPNQTETRTRTRAILVLLGLVFLPFALLAVAGYVLLARGPVRAAEHRLRAEAHTLANEIDRGVADLLDTDRYSKMPSPTLQYYTRRSNRWYRGRSRSSIERFLRSNAGIYRRRLLQGQPSLELRRLREAGRLPEAELVLTDSVGRVLGATSSLEQVLCGDEHWWLRAYGEGHGGEYLGLVRAGGACSVVVAAPVYDSTGDTLRGILRLTRHLPQLEERVRSVSIGTTGFASLVNGAYDRLVPREEVSLLSDESWRLIALVETLQHGGHARNDSKDALFAVVPVPSTAWAGQQRWVVVVAQSRLEFAPRRNALAYGLAVLLLAVVAAVAVAVPAVAPRKRRIPVQAELVRPVVDRTSQVLESEPEPEPGLAPGHVPEPEQAPVLGNEPESEPRPAQTAADEDAVGAPAAADRAEEDDTESLKSALVATIARELRAPLPPIVDLATLLMKDDVSEDSRQKFLAIIVEEGRRLMELVDKLSTLSLLESGKHELNLEEVDIRRIVDRVVEVEARHQPRHQLSIEIPDDLPRVRADPERLSTAVRVLVSNAVKYSPAGGPVTISAREEDGFIAISVADRGVGIRDQDMPMLFRRFQRLNREATPNVRGLGLGLSICKGIVEQHGGRVKVDSVYGEGSTFTLFLPINGPADNRQVPLGI
ncbi:MAG: hypothetical protein JSU73_10520 [candidate division WOR-3 bacterium]|nr:MAG: hypothetical protein JSU73_10520 [candidate division WOR-3 bacterium]